MSEFTDDRDHDGPVLAALDLTSELPDEERLEICRDLLPEGYLAVRKDQVDELLALSPGGPHCSATEAFTAAMSTLDQVRRIAASFLASGAKVECE